MSSADLTVLHRLVWFNDHETLDIYLTDLENNEQEQISDDIDHSTGQSDRCIDLKFRGLSPIMLAIELGHSESVKVLVKHGASMFCSSELGFLPLQEATSMGDREVMKLLLVKQQDQLREYFHNRQPVLYKVITEDIPDFYLEMNWNFKSWVPFFAMLCPSDCYKIWKKGNQIRIDTTLIGFDNLHWIRGNVSFLFRIGADSDSSFYIIDHKNKHWQQVQHLKEFTADEVEQNINIRLNQEIVNAKIDTNRSIRFARTRSLMGLGDDLVEDVGKYRARVYSIENLDWVTRTRKEHLRDRPEGDLSETTSSWFLGYGGRTPFSRIKQHERRIKSQKVNNSDLEISTLDYNDNEQFDIESTDAKTSEIEENEPYVDSEYHENTATDSTETLYNESMKEISEALEVIKSDDKNDISGIKDHLPDFDPHQINSLIDDSKKLAFINTPSLLPPTNRNPIPFEEYFIRSGATEKELEGLEHVHMGRKLLAKEHRKRLSASVWMANHFPLTIEQLLPLFEILSPSNEHFGKLREFISMKLPPGFPVQVEIPVLLFLSARITFRSCHMWTKETRRHIPTPAAIDPNNSASKNWFKIPENYTEGVVIKNFLKP